MINETTYLEKVQAVSEDSSVVEKKMVDFQRTWVFWENYLTTEENRNTNNENKDKDWNAQIKKVFSFSDLITFWQFWNSYPGSNPKDLFYDGDRFMLFFESRKRIDGLNLFAENISPKWEDSQNAGGRIFQLQYDIKKDLDEFLEFIKDYWLKLVLFLIGESLPCSHLVNGIRFVDKSKPKQKILYRIEIWISSAYKTEENIRDYSLNDLKDFLKKNFGSDVDDKPINPIGH
eukprot:CAMPEP_0170518768 /NCGR_PEP_ID=MMETSP0209-20121228/4376_1 /TAXON_ID=665100 ORGANISM="Litonotus pictus, Strain P1" /NCGR_SAMPLE_ID=MMETSP0209 /ASSEMBLY_ACC=CAM_ASM_000301 /LENGTH=231 /DNA_ID=CAMNT_0010804449 /DNA_START=1 /DNA_END=696 /DNA_ORIENTATION=+